MLEGAKQLVNESHEQLVRLNHRTPAGVVTDLGAVEGSLIFDEGRAPYATLRASAPIPDTTADLDAIDPRTGSQLELHAGYLFEGGPTMDRQAALRLDSRDAGRPSDRMQLVALGAEQTLMDWNPLEQSRTIAHHHPAGSAIAGIIWWALPATASVTVDPDTDVLFLTDADEPIVIDATSDVLEVILDIADRAGLWAYDQGAGNWRIRKRPAEVGQSSVILNVGENGTVIDTNAQLARNGSSPERSWANVVVVIHRWTDDDGQQRREVGWAAVTSGAMSVENAGRKVVKYERSTPASSATASIAAESLLRRHATRGRRVSLRAIAAWWVRPGDTATVQLPQGPQQRLLVARVEFGLSDGTMRIDLRHPETFDITSGE